MSGGNRVSVIQSKRRKGDLSRRVQTDDIGEGRHDVQQWDVWARVMNSSVLGYRVAPEKYDKLSISGNKKVLLIEHTWPEFVNSRVKLGESLVEQGYEVYAFLPAREGIHEYRDQIVAAGIKVVTYEYTRNNTGLMANLNCINEFRKVFQQYQFDIVHSFKFQPNFYATVASMLSRKCKVVLHVTGLGIVFSKPKTFRKSVLKYICKAIYLLEYMFAAKIVFQNPDDSKDLWFSRTFSYKCKVVEGSGVDVSHFDRANYDVEELRQSLGVQGKIVLTFIGRLVWAKGIEELIVAVEKLAHKYPNLQLLVVGETDDKSLNGVGREFVCKYDNHQQIKFLGYRSDTAQILSITNLFVYPSYYREGVPRTVLEAISSSVPVVTTNMPGCSLTVKEGANGYLIEPRSVAALEQAIEKILSTGDTSAMQSSSRALALERFQNSIVHRKIEDLYRGLVVQ